MIDAINQAIVSELKQNARIGWGDLAGRVGISRQALKKRVERLEQKGHIKAYTIITSHQQASPGSESSETIRAFFRIRFSKGNSCFKLSQLFSSYENILSAWAIAGNWDALVLVEAGSMEEVSEIREIIVKSGGIDEIRTEVALVQLYHNDGA